ncbi:hypothetical protein ROZALSC1DRAFT_20494, partial [Rozella allomycis CSF55]
MALCLSNELALKVYWGFLKTISRYNIDFVLYLPRTTIIILGGDWNSVLNPMLDRTNNDTSKIPELKQMHKLMRKKFYDPFRHLHSLQQDFTFSHRNKDTIFEARLDYFLVNTRAILAV